MNIKLVKISQDNMICTIPEEYTTILSFPRPVMNKLFSQLLSDQRAIKSELGRLVAMYTSDLRRVP